MRWNHFARSVFFAAIAGTAWPAFALAAAPLFGFGSALSLYMVGATGLYVVAIAPGLARGVACAGVAIAIAVVVAAVIGATDGSALGAALALGVVRSGLLYRGRRARAIALEVVLLGGGLALARFLFAPGLLGPALALWGFFLVQSAYFTFAGLRVRDAGGPETDRFDRARRRALALLEEQT